MPSRKPPISNSGTPITDKLIGELADEMEAGYDLRKARRVGRPSLGGDPGSSPRVNFRVSADVHARAAARAEREGKTVSELAREALERYVA